MKNLLNSILLITVLFIGMGITEISAQSKVAHINSNELLESMPEKAVLATKVQDFAKRLENQLVAMSQEYELKVQDFQKQQGVMTEAIKQIKVKEITDLENRIQKFQQDAQIDLQNEESRLLQPLIDRLKKAINDVAADKGYDYVLDTSLGVILYSKDSDDLMSLVKKKLAAK